MRNWLMHTLSIAAPLVTLCVATPVAAQAPGEPTSQPTIDIHGAGPPPPSSRPAGLEGPSPTPVRPEKVTPKKPRKPLPPPQVRALRRHPAIGRRFFIGVGFSLGVFWPPDVNSYIEGYADSLPGVVEGDSTMRINLVPRLAVALKLGRYFQLAGLAELGWGFTTVTDSGGDVSELFSFWRFSGGILASANLPLSALRGDALFAGLGPMVHHMRFEDFRATAVGFRAAAGYRFYEGIMLIDAFIAVDVVRGDTGEPIGFGNSSAMVLNYSGVLFGATVYFGVF